MKPVLTFFAAAMLIAGTAQARAPEVTTAELTLAAPAAKTQYLIDGAVWKCQDTACRAAAVADMTATRACQRVVAETGAVTAFTWRGRTLTAAELTICNAKAK